MLCMAFVARDPGKNMHKFNVLVAFPVDSLQWQIHYALQTMTNFEPLHKLQAHDGYILKCLLSPELCEPNRLASTLFPKFGFWFSLLSVFLSPLFSSYYKHRICIEMAELEIMLKNYHFQVPSHCIVWPYCQNMECGWFYFRENTSRYGFDPFKQALLEFCFLWIMHIIINVKFWHIFIDVSF